MPLPMRKYPHNANTLRYSAVIGQTRFMIHIACGRRTSSMAINSAQKKAIPNEIHAMDSNTAMIPSGNWLPNERPQALQGAGAFSLIVIEARTSRLAYPFAVSSRRGGLWRVKDARKTRPGSLRDPRSQA